MDQIKLHKVLKFLNIEEFKAVSTEEIWRIIRIGNNQCNNYYLPNDSSSTGCCGFSVFTFSDSRGQQGCCLTAGKPFGRFVGEMSPVLLVGCCGPLHSTAP